MLQNVVELASSDFLQSKPHEASNSSNVFGHSRIGRTHTRAAFGGQTPRRWTHHVHISVVWRRAHAAHRTATSRPRQRDAVADLKTVLRTGLRWRVTDLRLWIFDLYFRLLNIFLRFHFFSWALLQEWLRILMCLEF